MPMHLDLGRDDREATVDRLWNLGVSVRETKTETLANQTNTWTVMEYSKGNGFYGAEYRNELC